MRALLIAVALAVSAAACGGSSSVPEHDFVVGGLYWAPADDGSYFVYKLVARDDEGVHILIYSNSFDGPPSTLDEADLYLADRGLRPGDQVGVDHVQVGWEWITTWDTALIQMSTVSDADLDGYRRWLMERSAAFN